MGGSKSEGRVLVTGIATFDRAHNPHRERFHVFCMGNPEKTQIVKKTRPLSRGHSVKWTPLQPNPHVPAGTGPLRPVALRRGRGTKWPPQIMTGGRGGPMGPLGRIIRQLGLGGWGTGPGGDPMGFETAHTNNMGRRAVPPARGGEMARGAFSCE